MGQPAVNRALDRLVARIEPKLRRAFRTAVLQLQASIPLDAIERAIARGDVTPEILVRLATFPERLKPVGAVIAQGFEQAGLSEAGHVGRLLDVAASFNSANPRAVTWAATESGQLIRQIDEGTRQAVQEVIARSFTEALPPRETAPLIRDLVGLTSQQEMAVINYRFTLLEEGRSPDEVARLAKRYATKLHKYRARTIARTEASKSASAGQQEAWRQAAEEGYLDPETVIKVWIASRKENMCDVCAHELNQQRVVGLETAWSCSLGEIARPPAHVCCLCRSALIPA
ncbi:MAG: hypothetical protein PHR30_16390 [Gallionellaceae bacterium]|nr:hypothetical protein [Gallionellaceae bacterium]